MDAHTAELRGFVTANLQRLHRIEGWTIEASRYETAKAARDYLHNTLGQHEADVVITWSRTGVAGVLIYERSAVDRLADLLGGTA